MPTFELALVCRALSKPELVATVKRAGETILENGGIIRKIEYLGTKNLPHTMRAHGMINKMGSYFIMNFDTPPSVIPTIRKIYSHDIDIIRPSISKVEEDHDFECTLEEELQPPAYRKDVKKMIREGQKKVRQFNPKTGLDYYPFQR